MSITVKVQFVQVHLQNAAISKQTYPRFYIFKVISQVTIL